MTTISNKRYSKPAQPYARDLHTEADRSHDPIPGRHHVTEIVIDEVEDAMVSKYAFALALFGMTPLIVFLVVHYFFPDLLLFLEAQHNDRNAPY